MLGDLFADIMTNKKLQAISRVFISQSSFSFPKDARLNTTHYFIMKINNRIELKNIVTDHSADIDYQDFKKIYRECIKEPFNFLTIDTLLPTSGPLRFRKKLFDSYRNDNNWLNFRQKNYAKWSTIWFGQKSC